MTLLFEIHELQKYFVTTRPSDKLKCKMGGVVPRSKLGARRYYARRCKDGTPRCEELW